MSNETIFLYAIGVFVLMSVGIILTMIEFNKLTDDPSVRKGSGHSGVEGKKNNKADMHVIYSKDNAA